MDQSELGKNEEEKNIEASSAELSEPEMVNTPDATEDADNGVSEPAAATEEETVATTDTTDDASDEETADDNASDDAASDQVASNGLSRGMLVTGKIVKTSPTEVIVDLGEDREGLVPGRELELMTKSMLDGMREGEEITVFVVNPRNHRGVTVLSISQAMEEMDWREAETFRESKEVYDGKIGGYNKGGLIVRFGQLRGFVPQSQISDTRLRGMTGETPEERYGGMVNDDISVKVMEVDRSRNRLILSERAAMREVRKRAKEALITELEVGEIREGEVVSLENFGAFVDVGGAEGLVHITEISWQHITHPRQVLEVGDEVNVKVISVDQDQNRIGLSIKALLPDPWDEIRAAYQDGALVKATVTKLTKFGAFARLHGEPSVEGLIHISELSENRVDHPRDVVNKGDELTLRVVKVDVKGRRLGLSLKQVNSDAYLDVDMERAYREAANKSSAPVTEEDDEDVPAAGSVVSEDDGDDVEPTASAEVATAETDVEPVTEDAPEEASDEPEDSEPADDAADTEDED